jgi:hypothetical protein
MGTAVGLLLRADQRAQSTAGGPSRDPGLRGHGLPGHASAAGPSLPGFFRRCRAGETPGFPRFKGRGQFDSVQWQDGNGWALNEKSQRLRLHGIVQFKVRLHRPDRGTPKTITLRREGRRFWVNVHCVDVPAEPLPATGREVGIDLGSGPCWPPATGGW